MNETVKKLNALFAGKKVSVESKSSDGRNPWANEKVTSTCKTFHARSEDVDIELIDGSRYGLVPENITKTSVEGKVECLISQRRIVKLI